MTCLSWVYGGLIILTAICCGRVISGSTLQVHSKVTNIYFGTVEPPVVAQCDITIRVATSSQELEQKPLECSSIAWVDGYLIITSDRHRHVIFTCPIDLSRMTIGQPQAHVFIRNEQNLLDDAECITIRHEGDGPPVVYVMCSLSNGPSGLPLPMRRHMLSFTINRLDPLSVDSPIIFSASGLRDAINVYFKDAGVPPYRTYFADYPGPDKNTYRWGNIEGMAFTPDGSLLLCGMRNPLYDGNAILFAIESVDKAFLAKDPTRLKLVDLFSLELGNRGISDLCWDPLTKGYLITAAKSNGPKLDNDQPFPPNTLDSALYWWSGRKKEKPILIAKMPDMKVEAVCRLGDSQFIAIGSDEGDVSESRTKQQQSVITIFYFTGIESQLPQ